MAKQILVELPDIEYQHAEEEALLHQQEMKELLSEVIKEGLAARKANREAHNWSEPDPAVDREMAAYIALHPQLKKQYMGQHVAIYNGQLIDHDQDFEALFERIDKAYPDEFVWLATVEEEPIPTIYHRSIRFIQNS